MVHLPETDGDAPTTAAGDTSDGYQSRIDQEWKDQLEANKNEASHESDIDARALYGEQAVHNFPDVHADWGDDTLKAARARAIAVLQDENGSSPSTFADTGWNTEYRAGLEQALETVRDSKQMMANLKTVRRIKKDIDDGVEIGHLKGKTASEANVEWEKERVERLEAEQRKRRAVKEIAENNSGKESDTESQRIEGLPALPDFLKPAGSGVIKAEDEQGAVAAARALAAKHDEWISTLGGSPVDGERVNDDAGDEEIQESGTLSATPQKGGTTTPSKENLNEEFGSDSDDPDTSFFNNFTSLSPLRRAAGSKTENQDFWQKEMWGDDQDEDDNLDDELANAEAEMAELCTSEISKARRMSVGEE